jgi:hypothetical protein
MRHGRFITVISILVSLTASGCLFEPRTPEEPGEEERSWINPTNPKAVFSNLKTGLAEQRNSNYERSLAANFTFIPQAEDEATLGSGAFEDWTKQVEMEMLTRLKGDYPLERSIEFGQDGNFDRESIEVGKAEFEGAYVLVIKTAEGAEETYSGKAIFYIEDTSQGWALVRWEDIDVFGSNPTFGYLRGTLRGGS